MNTFCLYIVSVKRIVTLAFLFTACCISNGRGDALAPLLVRCRETCHNLPANVEFVKDGAAWKMESAEAVISENAGAELDQIAQLSSLVSLRLRGKKGGRGITAEGIGHLARLPHLRVLILQSQVSGDAVLAICQKLQGLEELGLENCDDVGDDDLAQLGTLSHLRRFELRRTLYNHAITRTLLGHVRALHDLRQLSINGVPDITDENVTGLQDLAGISQLDFADTGVTIAGIVALNLPNLEDLTVGHYAGKRELAAALPNVRVLKIWGGSRPADAIRLPPNLRRLTLVQTRSAPHFDPPPQGLDYLNVYDPNFNSRADLNWIKSFVGLRELKLLSDGDSSLAAAAQCKSLRAFTLAECSPPTPAGMDRLADMPDLESLAVTAGMHITDRELKLFSNLSKLRNLELDSLAAVTPDGLAKLSKLVKLKSLTLGMDERDPAASFDRTLEQLSLLPALEEASLHNLNMTDEGLQSLKQSKLRRLNLVGCHGFTDSGLSSLQSWIPTLQYIAISYP